MKIFLKNYTFDVNFRWKFPFQELFFSNKILLGSQVSSHNVIE